MGRHEIFSRVCMLRYENSPGRDLLGDFFHPAGRASAASTASATGGLPAFALPFFLPFFFFFFTSTGLSSNCVFCVPGRPRGGDCTSTSSGCGGGLPGVREAGIVGSHDIFSLVNWFTYENSPGRDLDATRFQPLGRATFFFFLLPKENIVGRVPGYLAQLGLDRWQH